MPRWVRWTLGILAVLLVLLGVAYFWFIGDGDAPETLETFALDIGAIRAAADSVAGDKPTEIRVERVATMTFPRTAAVAGDSWDSLPMGLFSYRLVSSSGDVVIDSAMTAAAGASMSATTDQAAFDRMQAAMLAASAVIITHEHPDHIGGIIGATDPAALGPHLRLTSTQLDSVGNYGGLRLPTTMLVSATPMVVEAVTAVVPGVVLIQAPGHTPGSQMVFVQRADGAEFLFVGDIAWSMRNVETGKGKPRLLTQLMLGENRERVFAQLAAIKALSTAEPDLVIVPGHDAAVIDKLVADGKLIAGF